MTRAMGFMEENILQNETKEPEKPAVYYYFFLLTYNLINNSFINFFII